RTLVDVAHDPDARRALLEVGLAVFVDLRLLFLVGDVLDRDLAVHLGGDQLDLVVRQGLRDLDHLPQVHHHLDDLRRRDAEGLRQVADGHARLDRDRPGRVDDLAPLLRPRVLPFARLTSVARTRGAGVDDDTAAPARSSG